MQAQSSAPLSIQECAGRAFGMSIGNLFLGFFGMAWLALGLRSVAQMSGTATSLSPEKASAPVLLLLCGFLSVLVIASLHIMRRTRGLLDPGPASRATQKKINRWFGLINFVQWALIIAAINGLGHFGLGEWIVPAIVLIVGVHFFPLARLFANRIHYFTGSVIVAWAIAYPILFSPGKGDGIGSIGMGLILWTCAAYMCWRALQLLRRVSPSGSAAKGPAENSDQPPIPAQ